jgi:hypothetical protein
MKSKTIFAAVAAALFGIATIACAQSGGAGGSAGGAAGGASAGSGSSASGLLSQ